MFMQSIRKYLYEKVSNKIESLITLFCVLSILLSPHIALACRICANIHINYRSIYLRKPDFMNVLDSTIAIGDCQTFRNYI